MAGQECQVEPIRDRMPVILAADAIGPWLAPETPTDRLQELLAPAPDDLLEAVAVSKMVNSPKNDGPECIEPAVMERLSYPSMTARPVSNAPISTCAKKSRPDWNGFG